MILLNINKRSNGHKKYDFDSEQPKLITPKRVVAGIENIILRPFLIYRPKRFALWAYAFDEIFIYNLFTKRRYFSHSRLGFRQKFSPRSWRNFLMQLFFFPQRFFPPAVDKGEKSKKAFILVAFNFDLKSEALLVTYQARLDNLK